MSPSAPSRVDRNFIAQQGLAEPASGTCVRLTSALLFQPRVVGVLAVIAVVGQWPWLFAALAVSLWWSALLPRVSPFDALYHATLGNRPDAPRLEPARPPRRFAQGMAATFMTAIALCLAGDAMIAAYVLEGFLLAAVAAISLGKFCLGSFVYHLVRGRVDYAVRTLPWGQGP